jgi:peptidoglycan hydrolase-like protein with peptidoglycan-binding domain
LIITLSFSKIILMRKTLATLVIAGLLFGSSTAFAATTTSTQSVEQLIAQLTAQITQLKTQLEALKTAQQNLGTTKQSVNDTLELIGDMREGMTSEQVALLQTALAGDTAIYPEGKITGYYGALTAKAIKRFQKKHGLTENGRMDEKTTRELNRFLRETGLRKENGRICIPPGHTIAPGWLKKEKSEKKGKGNGVINWQKEDILLPLCNAGGNATTTPPTKDTTAPTLSAFTIAAITANSATIAWTTNEHAATKIFLSTVSPVATGTATWTDATYTLAHSATLSGLTANTVYYFLVEVKDVAGNAATGTQGTFTTTVAPDTTAPTISAMSATATGSTTATVAWTTNENASSKVYFGTTSPLNLTTAPFVFDATLAAAHVMNLTGLATGTVHYVVVESKDAANNAATGTPLTFTTTAL